MLFVRYHADIVYLDDWVTVHAVRSYALIIVSAFRHEDSETCEVFHTGECSRSCIAIPVQIEVCKWNSHCYPLAVGIITCIVIHPRLIESATPTVTCMEEGIVGILQCNLVCTGKDNLHRSRTPRIRSRNHHLKLQALVLPVCKVSHIVQFRTIAVKGLAPCSSPIFKAEVTIIPSTAGRHISITEHQIVALE